MSLSLLGKVALVTGAARGIGRSVALELAKNGADIIVNDLERCSEAEDLSATIAGLGRRTLLCFGDVSDRPTCERMFADITGAFGRLDILINNAAYSTRKPFLELTQEDVERTWGSSQAGVFHCSQLAARMMVNQRSGSIVTISSVHAFRPYPNASAYNAAKAAVTQLSASMALELAPHGVRVNVVEPGWIDTPGERRHNTEAEIAEKAERLPMGRLGTGEEVAHAVAFLCSELAGYITGATLRVDGGFSLKY